jgi:hypothetical protein
LNSRAIPIANTQQFLPAAKFAFLAMLCAMWCSRYASLACETSESFVGGVFDAGSQTSLSFSASLCRTLLAKIEMIPASWRLRAHIPPTPGIDLEATSGSPEDYDDRNGYLPDFLGHGSDFLVPLPLLKDTSDLVKVERAPKERLFELRYQNFSVVMSRSRRFCCVTAVNIDGSAPFTISGRPL